MNQALDANELPQEATVGQAKSFVDLLQWPEVREQPNHACRLHYGQRVIDSQPQAAPRRGPLASVAVD
jgi:hypothetical protein